MISDAFDSFRGIHLKIDNLKKAINHNYIEVEKREIEVDYKISNYREYPEVKKWIDKHMESLLPITSSNESKTHLTLKIEMALYLEKLGYNVSKEHIEDSESIWKDWLYTGFEVRSNYGTADVACMEEDVYVEVGYTPPKRVLEALDIRVENSTIYRKNMIEPVCKFISTPYSGKIDNNKRVIYVFSLKELPDELYTPDFIKSNE